jgi:5'-nucleotidase / UDP-sugar diphosphatase
MKRHFWVCSLLAVLLSLLMLSRPALSDPVVRLSILHLNDVYEIAPVSGGTQGGLARVATLRKQLQQQNANTFTILAGDLLSPSALGTASVAGEALAGKHMVAVLNALGLDYSTFGNHEFDLKAAQLQQRLKESKFTWISSNVMQATGQPFDGVPPHVILTVPGEGDTFIRVGLFGLTLASNQKSYVAYTDYLQAAEQQVAALAPTVDILIAVTHLGLEQDNRLAKKFPQIHLILGGHEHENMHVEGGQGTAPIFKADANARTVYIHDLFYDTASKSLRRQSRLQPVTAAIPEDPAVRAIVTDWEQRGFAAFAGMGFVPHQVVAQVPDRLDGLEASVRYHPTALTALIARSMLHAYPAAEVAFFNSGSIRIDDVLPPGPLTQYDVIRMLPFGGTVVLVEMPGSLLQGVLEQGEHNQGAGGYLQTANMRRSTDGTAWLINDKPLEGQRVYRAAVNDFLLTGQEHGLAFLTRDLPDLRVVQDDGVDIRQALIAQLQADFGTPGLAAASPSAACLPPEAFPLDQLPSVKLTLQPSRRQLPIGAPWSITGLLENQSAVPIYITNRFTALTLPAEILGSRVAAVPATFPTTEGTLAKSAPGYQVIKVFPQHTYPVVWHVESLTSVYRITELLAPGVQNWPQLFPMLWSDIRHMLFFHPHPYQIVATVHYWKTNPQAYLDCLQQPGRQVDVSTAPAVMTTMVVDLEASTWVILFGAWLGGITAYLFLVCMRKRPWSISGFLGAWLLGPTVALFLKRLGAAAFVVTINVSDFWGAIVIGYIAQYTGLQIIDRYVTRRPASDAPPAQPPPPPIAAGSTVDAPARRA